MTCGCQDKKQQKCGESTGNKSSEEQLKHLKGCKESLLIKVKEIDEAIAKIET